MAVRCSTQRGAGLAAGKRGALFGALLIILSTAGMAAAQTVVIDSTTSGSTYDAILDGFPGLQPLDGTPDFAGNALAVGFKPGVTREHGIAELPLAPLAGATANEIASATLTFNIDDILSTFGPGTDFDETGSDPIDIAIYSGNGTVALDDFNRGTHVATVATGGAAITDATLGQSGPIKFDVDVTDALKDLVAGNATFIGIVFSTNDADTGTSLDNLGPTGGPPGARGARFPYLTVEIEEAGTPSPAPSASPSPAPSASPSPSPRPSVTPTPSGPTPTPTAPPALTPSPAPSTAPTPGPSSGPTPVITPTGPVEPTSSPATTPTPAGSATPSASPTPASSASPGTTPTPGPTSSAGVTPTPPGTTATPVRTPTPTRRPTPTPTPPGVVPPESISQGPGYSGDQLLFYYDARASFTTFLNIRNQGDDELSVEIVFLGADLAPTIIEERITLPAHGTRTLDVGLLTARGLPASFGIALASAVDGEGEPVVSRALEGSFTIANLMIGSAWGAPAPARRAIRRQGSAIVEPALGTAIDGTTVALGDIRPDRLSIATYYDPETLEPATFAGNQLILISFDDLPGAGVTPAETTWEIDVLKNDGSSVDVDPLPAAGVGVTDLVTVAGSEVNGAAGSMHFSAQANGAENRLIFFTESVGTYSAGYLLPHPAPEATPGGSAAAR